MVSEVKQRPTDEDDIKRLRHRMILHERHKSSKSSGQQRRKERKKVDGTRNVMLLSNNFLFSFKAFGSTAGNKNRT